MLIHENIIVDLDMNMRDQLTLLVLLQIKAIKVRDDDKWGRDMTNIISTLNY